jgi:choline dehydrogenase-like flavoprotein
VNDVETRLKNRIVDGDRQGLEDDLTLAMAKHAPLDIINTHLLDGMKVVGELFGAGKMQLPFVLQSAETMKAAVGFLEPFMERVAGQDKGVVVMATVKGDVHDIGKNLVDIILTNNGYEVHNLGIKVAMAEMLDAAGCTDIRTHGSNNPPGHCIHEMGGARMSLTSKDGVLNKWNQAWDAKNLFITDGAVFVSNADKNPTLTIMALAWRSADRILDLMIRKEL